MAIGGNYRARHVLLVLAGLLMLADLYLMLMVAPTDSVLGQVQRIFYFHVPIAVMSFLAFFVVFLASVVFLVRRSPVWDRLAHASAEVGVVFVTLALITGVIWARPIWNTWWTWEPRLTTTLILWLIYVAYLMIRSYAPSRPQAQIYAAVVGIVGFVDVPIVYYSVIWWRSIHPSPVVGPLAGDGALNSTMFAVLLFSFLTFLVFFTYLVAERMAIMDSEDRLRQVRLSLRRSQGQT
ncbi:MAG: cytochrome C assembly protein [SAR202 cluster bacterium Io17-Chloro-G2]|nr:MAG: cytochrome C assembly protein [SAR202 cluster bacterium Io17-Chloro-G2]